MSTVVPFVSTVPDPIDKVQVQIKTKIKITETQTTTIDTITIRTIGTTTVAISKTTDTTIIAIQQINNKTEITQINNHVDIATEQIINPRIVKHVLIAEDWDTCLAKVEHRDKIRTIGNKTQMLTKTREITTKTGTQTPHSNRIL